jgi:two-component system, LytTR family, response regulator
MITAILVDDQESNSSSLKEKIRRHCPEVEIIATCNSAEEAIASIDSLKPGIVFLDIEMPVMNGFLVLEQLQFRNFELIFTTAYDHYAIKAIRFSALDYLVKPVEIDELKMAVERAEKKRTGTTSANQLELLLENLQVKKNDFEKIAIPTTDGLHFLKISEIIYLEANANYTFIYLQNTKRYTVCHTLKEFEDMLPSNTFVRVHNSYIINKNFAERYIRGDGGQVVLTNGSVIDISKRKKADFLKALGH